MRLRPLYALLGLLLVLALAVGVGSALLPPASRAKPGGIAESAVSPTTARGYPTNAVSRAPATPAGTRTGPPLSQATPPAGTEPALPNAQAAVPSATLVSSATSPTLVTPLAAVAASSPSPFPTYPVSPAANRVGGPVAVPENHAGRRWVTLQAGHLNISSLPIELQHLAGDTGAFAAGVSEVDLNIAVANRTAQLLSERGFNVEILDATVPVSYTTDLFLAIHADGNAWSGMRGFKAVAPWVSVPASDKFVGIFYTEYGKATGLPTDAVTSVAMADYYAFNPITYNHAIDSRVPAALIEMGFVTNPSDRQVMTEQQDRLAWGIANSVDVFFRSGAVGDTPTPYPSFTPTITPSYTPTATFTPSNTPTPTPTPSGTSTPSPGLLTSTSASPFPARPSPSPSKTTRPTATTVPSPTPLQGIVTADGRWLPPLAPNGRGLPQPGSNASPVLLNEAVDEPVMTPDGRERQQVWQQIYMPDLGRSVWRKGPLLYVRH